MTDRHTLKAMLTQFGVDGSIDHPIYRSHYTGRALTPTQAAHVITRTEPNPGLLTYITNHAVSVLKGIQ